MGSKTVIQVSSNLHQLLADRLDARLVFGIDLLSRVPEAFDPDDRLVSDTESCSKVLLEDAEEWHGR